MLFDDTGNEGCDAPSKPRAFFRVMGRHVMGTPGLTPPQLVAALRENMQGFILCSLYCMQLVGTMDGTRLG